MLKSIKINKIYRNTHKKDGTEYVDKRGNKFAYVTIFTTGLDGKDVRMGMCDYKDQTNNLKEGQTVELDVEKSGDFINFKLPSETHLLEKRVKLLEERLNLLESKGGTPAETLEEEPPPPDPPPEKEYDYSNDLPF